MSTLTVNRRDDQIRPLPTTVVELEALLHRIDRYLAAGDRAIEQTLRRASEIEVFLEATAAGLKNWALVPAERPHSIPFAPDIFAYMPAELRSHLSGMDLEAEHVRSEQLAWCLAWEAAESISQQIALLRDDVTLRRRSASWLADCLAAFRILRDMVLGKLGELETRNSRRRMMRTVKDEDHQVKIQNRNDARDAWIYERWNEGTAWTEIRDGIKKHNWQIISTLAGIKAAATRYANRSGLHRPLSRT